MVGHVDNAPHRLSSGAGSPEVMAPGRAGTLSTNSELKRRRFTGNSLEAITECGPCFPQKEAALLRGSVCPNGSRIGH